MELSLFQRILWFIGLLFLLYTHLSVMLSVLPGQRGQVALSVDGFSMNPTV